MRRCALNFDLAFNVEMLSLLLPIHVFQVIIEIGTIHGQIPTQQGSVGGKNGGNRNVLLANLRNRRRGHPFVKMGYYLAIAGFFTG